MAAKKPALTGKSYGLKAAASVCVISGVLIGSYFGYKAIKPKVVKSTTTTTKQVQIVTTTTTKKLTLDGNYSGTASVASGISEANVAVVNNSLTGTANYKGSYNASIPLAVSGTVVTAEGATKGNVSGTFSGSGTVMGQAVSVTGTFSGKITNSLMNVSYSAKAFGQTIPGQITLTNK